MYDEYNAFFKSGFTMKFKLKKYELVDDSDDAVDEAVYLHVEEIVAMILRHAKKMAEQFAKIDCNYLFFDFDNIKLEITDCIITVPSNWNLD